MAFAATSQVTVKKGDTLYQIAHDNGTTVNAIESENHLKTTTIIPGQILKIPVAAAKQSAAKTVVKATTKKTAPKTTTSSKSSSSKSVSVAHPSGTVRYHVVTSGETLWSISQMYGVTVANLCSWNHISQNGVLHLGQKLVIYGGKKVVAAKPAAASSKTSSSTTSSTSKSLGSRSETQTGAVASGTMGEEVVSYAKEFLGVPYVWGGESVHGFDCSGLVQFTYAHFGVSLPRDSYSQYQRGSSVSESNLMPGDLVFFDTDGAGASHVGIYVGSGSFINAAGSDVQIDSLGESYWSSHYIGARRVD